MKLASTRTLDAMREVLKTSNASGPGDLYWVFNQMQPSGRWENMTVISPGLLDGEFPKTYGHYHGTDVLETYKLISGQGILVMQKQYFENGVWVPNRVEKIYFVTASPGDEIVISKEFGHSWSNIGDTPLVSFDDWRSGHQPSDYEPMKNLRGLAYYLVADGGKVKTVKNENYNSLPDPIWITAQEFKEVNKI